MPHVRILPLLLVLALSQLLPGAPAKAASRGQAAEQAGPQTLTAVVLENFAPLFSLDPSGNPQGFGIDVAEHVAARAGFRLRYITVGSWDEAFVALREGRADIFPGAAITEERKAEFAFSLPYLNYRFVLMVLKANREINGFEDIAGRRVGVLQGGLAHHFLKTHHPAGLVVKDDIGRLLFDLQSGEIDAFFGPSMELESLARKAGIEDRLRIVGHWEHEGQRGFVLRKGETELLERINRALNRFILSEEFRQLNDRWYGVPGPFWSASRVAWLMGAVFALGILGMAVWRYRSLKAANRSLCESIAKLQQAEERLALAHAELEQVFEAAGTGMRVVGADYKVLRVNELFTQMTGRPAGGQLGSLCHENFPGSDCHTDQCTLRRILAGERRVEGEVEKVRADGSKVPCIVIATPYRDLDGRVVGIVESFHDITQRRHLEALREDVERIVRHDLKTPLISLINGCKVLLMDEDLNPEQVELVSFMEESSYRMLNMINLSLDLFRMENRAYRLQAKEIDVSPIVARVLRDLRGSIQGKRLRMKVDIAGSPAGLGQEFRILGEELLCYSMLSNLIKNAVEASPNQGTVGIFLGERGDRSEIVIRNQGSVPADIRERFFEKYATSGKSGGTGLGAYSARLIAETHGGGLDLDASVEGQTTLTVWLPGMNASSPAQGA